MSFRDDPRSAPDRPTGAELPFPQSLCHRCAAPPQYHRGRSTWFIRCPVAPNKYPPQPVLACPWFRPVAERSDADGSD